MINVIMIKFCNTDTTEDEAIKVEEIDRIKDVRNFSSDSDSGYNDTTNSVILMKESIRRWEAKETIDELLELING